MVVIGFLLAVAYTAITVLIDECKISIKAQNTPRYVNWNNK